MENNEFQPTYGGLEPSDTEFIAYTIRDKVTGLYVGWDAAYTLGPFSHCSHYRTRAFALDMGETVKGNLMRTRGQKFEPELIEIICMNGGPVTS